MATQVVVTATLMDGFAWDDSAAGPSGFARGASGPRSQTMQPVVLPEGWTLVSPTQATFAVTLPAAPLCGAIVPEDPAVVPEDCTDCPTGPSIEPAETDGLVYEVSPAGPWSPGQTVTVFARLVGAASGFREPLPAGWTAVDSSTATFEVTIAGGGELARTGVTSALTQLLAAALAVGLGSLLVVIGARRRRT